MANGPSGDYEYQTVFNLTGLDPSTAVLTGQWATDDPGVNIYINSQPTGNTIDDTPSYISNPTPPYTYSQWTRFTISSGFVAGVNTLDFVVYNIPNSGPNPAGLRVEISGSADPVPEPASLMLIGAGFVALGMFRGRKV